MCDQAEAAFLMRVLLLHRQGLFFVLFFFFTYDWKPFNSNFEVQIRASVCIVNCQEEWGKYLSWGLQLLSKIIEHMEYHQTILESTCNALLIYLILTMLWRYFKRCLRFYSEKPNILYIYKLINLYMMADPFKMNKLACCSFWVAFIIYHVCVSVFCRFRPFNVLQMQKVWSLNSITDKTVVSSRVDGNPTLCHQSVQLKSNLNNHHWTCCSWN